MGDRAVPRRVLAKDGRACRWSLWRSTALRRCLPWVSAAVPSVAVPLEAQGGAPIVDTVIIRTHDLFDDAEAAENALFRLANGLRFRTRPSVVRRELLFRPGQPLDTALTAESARNLRALRIFRDVSIDTARVNGRLAAVVETRDGWSTQLQLNGQSTGGEFTWAVGLIETNFLGTANVVGAVYRHDPDRNAVRFRGLANRVFGTRGRLDAAYDNREDGDIGSWVLGVPFRALADREAIELFGEVGRLRVLQFRDGDSAGVVQRRVSLHRLQGASAPRAAADGYLRVSLAAQLKREEYAAYLDSARVTPDSLVPDSLSGAFGIGLDWLDARFAVVTHYNGFAREEDVDLSTRVRAGVWLAPAGWGYDRFGVGPTIEAQGGLAMGRSFLRVRAEANALVTSGGVDSSRVRGSLTAAALAVRRHATVLHVQGEVRRGLPPGSEIDLGHGVGPRAFRSHAFTGTRAVWGTLEHRWFAIDEVANLFGLGFAAFVDYGGAWYSDQAERLGGDVGVGLRIGATRATGTNVGRIDVAYKFGDGVGAKRWTVSVGRSVVY